MSLCTLASRVLGLVRDVVMAACFGTGPILDAFTVAFRIPNLARRLFGEGALTTAFLPVFVRVRHERGLPAAWRLSGHVFRVLGCFLMAGVVLGELLLWGIWSWTELSTEALLLLELTAILLPYLILICLAAQLSAVLHAVDHFGWPAVLPLVLNVVWIAGLVLVQSRIEDPRHQIHLVSAAIVLAGFLQLLCLLPELYRRGFRWLPIDDGSRRGLRDVFRGMAPVLFGLSLTQLNSVMDSVIAWSFSYEPIALGEAWLTLPVGTASALYLGQRMFQFPLGVFGVALGTVLFPRFSRHVVNDDRASLGDDVALGMKLVSTIGIPASAGLVVLSEPITELLFRHGQFTASDSRMTAAMVAGYGAGVWAFCGLTILNRVFYASNDRLTPVRLGMAAIAINLPLNFLLAKLIGGSGLAWATTVAGVAQLALTIRMVRTLVPALPWLSLLNHLARVAVATGLMIGCCSTMLWLLPESHGSGPLRLLRVFGPVLGAAVVYDFCCRGLRITELRMLWRR